MPVAGPVTNQHFFLFIFDTRIMINKGMFNKGKYWIFGINKGVLVSNLEGDENISPRKLSQSA